MKNCHFDNYNININLLKLNSAFVGKYKTNNGEQKRCIVIPVEPNKIFLNEEKGKAMLGMVAIHRKKEGDDTHYIQNRVNPSTIVDKKPPIVGHMNVMQNNDDYQHDEDVVEQ